MIKRILIGLVALVVVAYVGFIVALYVLQRDFQYDKSGRLFASERDHAHRRHRARLDPERRWRRRSPRWYQPPQPASRSSSISAAMRRAFRASTAATSAGPSDGYGFLAFDYRGFPGSPGEITEANILADGLAAFDWLEEKGLPHRPLGPLARLGPCDLGRQGTRGRRAVSRDAARFGGRRRRRPLRLCAGRPG